MTAEEAIKTLKGEAWVCCSEKWNEALGMAVEALKAKPCTDAVSRQAVIDIVNNPLNIRLDEIIKKLPPVTPQPKTAHWIHFANSDDCSGCGWSTGKYISPSNFCPNCGARMVEPQESEGEK